jgi:drug/metabolite transporter (DMT)-like permease
MFAGILFALGACFLWGAIFIVPTFLPEFSLMEVALGRYFAYGILSLALFLIKSPKNFINRYSLRVWTKAATFALVSNIIYYIGVVIGLRFATPPITVLVIGMCPILAALYGNFQSKEVSWKTLFLPCLCMTAGIFLVNVTEIHARLGGSLREYLFGLLGAAVALVSWSWYAVKNAQFLKENPTLPRTEWATLIGVTSLVWVTVFSALFAFGPHPLISLGKFAHFTPEVGHFLLGISILGILCAWLGCFLWNHASTLLPMTLMGPFIIFETIFGLCFVFVVAARLPSVLESLGIILMLGGIIAAVLSLRKKPEHVT